MRNQAVVQWVHLHPQGGERNRRNLQGKFVSAHHSTPSAPPSRARANFRTFLLGGGDLEVGVVHLVVLDRLLRATTKNVVNFLRKKYIPPEKNPGYAYANKTFCPSVRPSVCHTGDARRNG